MTTPEAPTPEIVESALQNLELGTAWSTTAELDADMKTIRAHIASLEHRHDDLVTRCVQAEDDVDRLRGALCNVQSYLRAFRSHAFVNDVAIRCVCDALETANEALNPEQKGGV